MGTALSLLCVKRPRTIFTEADDNSTWVPPKRTRVTVTSPRTPNDSSHALQPYLKRLVHAQMANTWGGSPNRPNKIK